MAKTRHRVAEMKTALRVLRALNRGGRSGLSKLGHRAVLGRAVGWLALRASEAGLVLRLASCVPLGAAHRSARLRVPCAALQGRRWRACSCRTALGPSSLPGRWTSNAWLPWGKKEGGV